MKIYVLWTLMEYSQRWEFSGLYRTTHACVRAFPDVVWHSTLEDWPYEVVGRLNGVTFRLVLETLQD